MNMLDMQTREKVNKVRLAEMHRDKRDRYTVHDLSPVRFPAVSGRRIRLVLLGVVLVLLAGIVLISATVFLILQSLG